MDRQLAERMVGAAVLLGVLVLVVPAVLDGGGDRHDGRAVPAEAPIDLKSHTIHLDGDRQRPPVPSAVVAPVEPAPAQSAPPEAARPIEAVPPVAAADAAAATPDPGTSAPAGGSASRPGAPAPDSGAPAAVAASIPSVPAAAGSPATGEWLVQLGSFASRPNAERLAAAARGRGFAANVSETRGAGGLLYRVRVGPAGPRAEAEQRARDLAAAGYKGAVTRR